MHQVLAGLLQSKLCVVILASHSSPSHTRRPFPTTHLGKVLRNHNGKLKWEGLVVPCSFDTHIYPPKA